jgi:hypothetical protein
MRDLRMEDFRMGDLRMEDFRMRGLRMRDLRVVVFERGILRRRFFYF